MAVSAVPADNGIVIAAYQSDVPPRVWEMVGPKLAEAVQLAGSLTVDGIRTLLEQHQACLMLAVRMAEKAEDDEVPGALLVTVEDWTDRRVLCVLAASGHDFNHWAPAMLDALVEYMHAEQCDCIRCLCRPGMAKKLKLLGFKSVMQTMEYRDHGTLQ